VEWDVWKLTFEEVCRVRGLKPHIIKACRERLDHMEKESPHTNRSTGRRRAFLLYSLVNLMKRNQSFNRILHAKLIIKTTWKNKEQERAGEVLKKIAE
jgi:hypothetical protein